MVIVRYRTWSDMMCPSSWPRTKLSSSSSSSATVPELRMMKGRSIPYAPAFTIGVCETNRSYFIGASIVRATSS